MYCNKSRRCDDRIVSLTGNGLASVDRINWEAFREGGDLKSQVEAYQARHGVYPESLHAYPIYGTRENRTYLKGKGIRYAGKPLGRPWKVTEQNAAQLKREKQQRQADYRQRLPIEGKFGQGKNAYNSTSFVQKRPVPRKPGFTAFSWS